MREVIDLPPVWLALFAALVWLGAQPFQLGLPYGPVAGIGLIVAGLVLMGLAAGQMVLARTSFIPRRNPDALVTGGVFALSRNPIYLGDALVLAGLALRWEALHMIWLVPLFMLFITKRFILGEEARIAARFGPEFTRYTARTRRWL
ncbi:isoprenylcysteine carboxylmethyltransferase family protein [Defluviimonas nitratireducens]|nr:isoprenylcysteine carboxylmethyltransferase family protein [Defluviimonas nitratireducens]MDF1619455.1 isoprenylcysteine carboxylmethyltransferase family protein [Defluviimonas nitratireducens]